MNTTTRILLGALLFCSVASQCVLAGHIETPDDVGKNVADAKETLTGLHEYVLELENQIRKLKLELETRVEPEPIIIPCNVSTIELAELEKRILVVETALANCQLTKFDTDPTRKLLKEEIDERTERLNEMANSVVESVRRRIKKTAESGVSRREVPSAESVWKSSQEEFDKQTTEAMNRITSEYIDQAEVEIRRITEKSRSILDERINNKAFDVESKFQSVADASKEQVSSSFEKARDKLKGSIETRTKTSDEQIKSHIDNANWSIHLQKSNELKEAVLDKISIEDNRISGDLISAFKRHLESAQGKNQQTAESLNAYAQSVADRTSSLRSTYENGELVSEERLLKKFDEFVRRQITRTVPRPVVIDGSDNEEDHFKAAVNCYLKKGKKCFVFDVKKAGAIIPYASYANLKGLKISFENDNSCEPTMAPQNITVTFTSPMGTVTSETFIYSKASGPQNFDFAPRVVREVDIDFVSNRGNKVFTCVHEIHLIRHH